MGGIGIAPFLGWPAALEARDRSRVDLFYSTPAQGDAAYLEELRDAERRLGLVLRVRPVFTRADGHLTGVKVAAIAAVGSDAHVFLCDPVPMIGAFPASCAEPVCPATDWPGCRRSDCDHRDQRLQR